MRVIAIDGPAGAGKSSVARMVAAATGLPFLDTGAMYRCVALAVLRGGIDPTDALAAESAAKAAEIRVDGATVRLDGEDVTDSIRTPHVNSVVSVIAVHSGVRTVMRAEQRAWAARAGGGVVEGRDIGTVVFPDAVLKVFLTASPATRAARRVAESGGDPAEVARSIEERDVIDSNREDSPLRPAEGSITVDSSEMSVAQVVDTIVRHYAVVSGGAA
ncbi:MAG: (d)CMP kinase [Actinomycetota bacterium]